MAASVQWSNYQKISKGAHTIVNANEAMLLITGGSRTSESGDKFFPKFLLPLFTGVSENLFAFSPQKCSSVRPKFLTTFFFFFSHRPFPWPDWPPWIRTSRGAEGGPLWTPRFY